MKKGYGKHYVSGPDPRWTEADRRNVEAFQRAQGWRGSAADGYPGRRPGADSSPEAAAPELLRLRGAEPGAPVLLRPRAPWAFAARWTR